jgi:non-heme chloroperoxidase
MLRKTLYAALAAVVLAALLITLAIAFGGPATPAPLASIGDPFKAVDFSDTPALSHYRARDGQDLAYRHYQASDQASGDTPGSVVLVHGSSSSGLGLHPLAKAFAAAGYQTYALDIRGHGGSGTRGTIDYVGQLEDDLVDFMVERKPQGPVSLIGFSAGGGFALRFAGSAHQQLFDSYLLMAPMISHKAPNYRPNSGGWVEVGMPRIIALMLLEQLGIDAFGDLPVVRFAVKPDSQVLTPSYSFRLQSNFRPLLDYQANIDAAQRPVGVLAGSDDEIFYSEKLGGIFREQGKDWPVQLLPGTNHIDLSLRPEALAAAVAMLSALNTAAAEVD